MARDEWCGGLGGVLMGVLMFLGPDEGDSLDRRALGDRWTGVDENGHTPQAQDPLSSMHGQGVHAPAHLLR